MVFEPSELELAKFDCIWQGRIQGGGGGGGEHPARAPPKIGKNMIFFFVKS
jgi:hypothetical protein